MKIKKKFKKKIISVKNLSLFLKNRIINFYILYNSTIYFLIINQIMWILYDLNITIYHNIIDRLFFLINNITFVNVFNIFDSKCEINPTLLELEDIYDKFLSLALFAFIFGIMLPFYYTLRFFSLDFQHIYYTVFSYIIYISCINSIVVLYLFSTDQIADALELNFESNFYTMRTKIKIFYIINTVTLIYATWYYSLVSTNSYKNYTNKIVRFLKNVINHIITFIKKVLNLEVKKTKMKMIKHDYRFKR